MASVGDYERDGYPDIVVGASRGSGGSIALYRGAASGFSYTGSIMAWGGTYGGFGTIIATCDLNGDGLLDVAAAAPTRNGASSEEGGVAVYLGTSTGFTYTPTASLASPAPEYLGRFGSGLACGDVGGDGLGDLLVGAGGEHVGSITRTGRLHFYLGSASGVSTLPLFTMPCPVVGYSAGFGSAVALVGDVTLDGWTDVAAAAVGNATPAGHEGVVWVFRGIPPGLDMTPLHRIDNPGSATRTWGGFGTAIASRP